MEKELTEGYVAVTWYSELSEDALCCRTCTAWSAGYIRVLFRMAGGDGDRRRCCDISFLPTGRNSDTRACGYIRSNLSSGKHFMNEWNLACFSTFISLSLLTLLLFSSPFLPFISLLRFFLQPLLYLCAYFLFLPPFRSPLLAIFLFLPHLQYSHSLFINFFHFLLSLLSSLPSFYLSIFLPSTFLSSSVSSF
jgi:hypothetical protein